MDANMTIKKLITLAILTCLPLTVSADFFQDQKEKAEADFDMEFGGCDAKVAKQQSQIEQLKVRLEDLNRIESERQRKINNLQNQLANRSHDVTAQLNESNRQVQAYAHALNEQKTLNNKLVTQNNILKLQINNNNAAPRHPQPIVSQVLDSSIDIVKTWDDASWTWTAQDQRNRFGLDFAFVCPPNGEVRKIFGTGHYMTNSSVCTAAVHAGLISVKRGGHVIFRIGGHKNSFKASYSNDIKSRSYRDYGSHFTFPLQ